MNSYLWRTEWLLPDYLHAPVQHEQGLYWWGLASCHRAQHAGCEGLDSCQEMRDEGTSLSSLGHVVPSQFLEVNVQEEGLAFHKLVGDLVDSHRLLSLFIIVIPVLLLQINVTEDCP